MKAFKLASGFAVSALTLAIAGTAVAEATTSVAYTGAVKVTSTLDLENSHRENGFPGYASPSDDWYHLDIKTTVSHGPFSGVVRIGVKPDTGAGATDQRVRVEDLKVVEGPISFGQIGRVTDSAGKYEGLTDGVKSGVAASGVNEKDEATRMGVTAAFRYTVADLGLKIQSESANLGASNNGQAGFAAGIMQDLGVAKVWADAQYRQDVNAADDGMDDAVTTFGAAVEASFDPVKVTGAVRNISSGNGGDGRLAFAVRADVAATDTVSVYGIVLDRNTGNDNDSLAVKAGLKATFAPITVEGSYDMLASAAGEGLVKAKVSWAEGAINAYGEVDHNLALDDDATGLKVGAGYTVESGIKYGADWELMNKGNALTAYAQYSF